MESGGILQVPARTVLAGTFGRVKGDGDFGLVEFAGGDVSFAGSRGNA